MTFGHGRPRPPRLLRTARGAGLLPLVVAVFSVGMYGGPSRVATQAAAVLVPMAVLLAVSSLIEDFTLDVIWGALFTLGPWLGGRALRASLDRNRELAAETERARFEAERAVTAERERIARELHDILAHSLSVMIVQASVAEDLLCRDTDAARDALHEVQQRGREALSETARLLRLIRDEEDELGLHPQHRLADVSDLAAELRRAGMEVHVELDGSTSSLPLGVQVSAYRIVQEALTNALKHAPGGPVSIRLARRGVNVQIEVRNGPATRMRLTDVASGQGLAGVRERVSLFGGTLRAEPTDDGGFLLRPPSPARRGDDGRRRGRPESRPQRAAGAARGRGIEVLAEAANGREAVEAARTHRPDVLVLDIRMPVLDGISATREVAAAGLATRVLILTTYDLDQYVYAALKAGAAGFMLKASPPDRLVDAIEVVAAGEALLAPSLTRRLISEHISGPPPAAGAPPALSELTGREREVLVLLARGLSNDEIAASLVVSVATVKTHVNRVLAKLGLRSRAQAVVIAYETGLVRPGGTTGTRMERMGHGSS